MKISGIHHIALKAQGIAKYNELLRFYRDILGLPVVRTWGDEAAPAAMVAAGESCLELFSDAPDTLSQGALRHLALAVDDVDAFAQAVRNAGYQITMEPTDIIIKSTPPLPARIAFCIGPVGEEVEFFKEK